MSKSNCEHTRNNHPVSTLQLTSAALVAVASFSSIAHATEEVITLETVTVAGNKQVAGTNPNADPDAPYKIDTSGNPKFTQPLLDTAKSIYIIGKEQLEDGKVTALKSLMATQPGITLGTGEGGNAYGDRFIIRGFEARGDVFMDGMRDPGSTNREVFNTEQVEIAKGASSTFAGRGTTGGAVNSVSKKPQEEDFAKFSLTVGEDDKRLTVDGNKVINDRVTVRANVLLQDSDVAGRNEVYDKRAGIALGVGYKATERSDLLVEYYHLRTESLPDFGVPWDSDAGKPADVGSNWYGIRNRDFQETGADIFTATLSTDFTDQTRLTTKLRTGKTTNDYAVVAPQARDGVISATNPKTAAYTNKFAGINSQLTHERHIGNHEHTFSIGFEVSKEEVRKAGYDIVGDTSGCTALDVYNPDIYQTGCGSLSKNNSGALTEVQTAALYAMDTIKFNEKFQAFGGIRYDYYDISKNSDVNEYDAANVASLDTDFLNGHLGLTYKPRDNGSIYATVSSSSNVPGELLDAGAAAYGGLTDTTAAFTKPEENLNFEIGTKWNLANDNLALTAAIFQIDKKNQLETSGGRGSPAVTTQTGEARVKGAEFSVSGKATPKLTLTAGAAYLDTEVIDSADASTIGLKLANVASKSAFVQAKYAVTPLFAVGGSITHTGEIHGGTFAATTGNTLASTNRLDLMAEYKVNKSLSLQANVINATDEDLYDSFYRSGSPFVFTGAGRSASLTMNYDF
ncbi:TonB-dependent receptor [Leucothrix pacifica]|uniref:TonB-dependent siderophore receptor n=1 Tax=Leucothrix pacifica TaxID=1247513 RepID=A0A317C2I4_9GAMM|nr:TonB-dependent receptor [Leucothrix pacifica]PWQ92549.1 TonB-dependent siderophore receptor [Leucothrix pacifica]